MSEKRQSALKRLWTASWTLGDPQTAAFLHLRLGTALVGVSVLVLAPAFFLGAFLFHLQCLAATGVVVLAVGMANSAVLEAFRIRWVLHLGRWTGWKGEPIWRNEHPVQFWARTAMHATVLTMYAAAAVFLIWLNLGRMAS